MPKKSIRYTADAAKSLKRHTNMASRIREAVRDYAESGSHANNVTKLVGVDAWRMRVGDFRVLFEISENELVVTKIGPRGGVYG